MKMKFWLILGTTLSTTLLAQQVTNSPPATPLEPTPAAASPVIEPAAQPELAVATNKAAAKPAKKDATTKKPAKKTAANKASVPASELKTIPLVAGPAVVVANRVNVRGRAGLKGEVLTRLTNGEPVMVVEEVKLKRSGPEEPSAWAKIVLPTHARVWVHASYIDATNKTVVPKKLNLRGGPGENYSVLGTLQRGDTVREIETKGNWMEIEVLTNAYAFVAAQYLSQEAPALAAATPAETTTAAPPEAAPAPTIIAEAPTVGAAAAETPTTAGEGAATPPIEAPPSPRIVQREGIVRYTASIQAPTMFQLISPDTHKTTEYLYTTSTNLDLNRYKGLHIIVTGEEGLDERWKTTPIITIQRIQVLE